MKVKIKNVIYDSTKEPIMLILTEKDKQLVAKMTDKDTRLCLVPNFMNKKEVKAFIKIEEEDSK